MRNFLRLSISCETKKNRVTGNWILEILSLKKILKNDPSYIQHHCSFSIHSELSWYISCLHDKKGSLTLEIFIDKMFFFIHWLKTNILTTLPYVELEFCKNQNKTRCKDLNLQLCNLPWNSLHEYEFQFCQLLLTRRFPNERSGAKEESEISYVELHKSRKIMQ